MRSNDRGKHCTKQMQYPSAISNSPVFIYAATRCALTGHTRDYCINKHQKQKRKEEDVSCNGNERIASSHTNDHCRISLSPKTTLNTLALHVSPYSIPLHASAETQKYAKLAFACVAHGSLRF